MCNFLFMLAMLVSPCVLIVQGETLLDPGPIKESGKVSTNSSAVKRYAVESPDKATRLEIGINPAGELVYRVSLSGEVVMDWSPMGFDINGVMAGEHTTILGEKETSRMEKFSWPFGENDSVVNHYREIELSCQSAAAVLGRSSMTFRVTARVFNGSIAFRYSFPEQQGFGTAMIRDEKTVFHFRTPYRIYQYHHESVFTPTTIDTFSTSCDLPATITNDRFYISIGEADNDSYTKAELTRGPAPHSLKVAFIRDSVVRTAGAFQSPWRTISISTTAIGLHSFTDLYLRLNPPPPGGVPPGIRPGKLIRSQLTTQAALECIDFAARHQFQYILFDAGWYGEQYRTSSDPAVAIPAIDMPQVVKAGKEKGIGVILYVNYVGLRRKLDSLLTIYKEWGISGLKFGFVDGYTQNGISWLASAIKKVNDAGFILDIHDNYKPTGLSRTYPALLTQEGVRGDENGPDAFHTTVLPFTRFLAGPADFTFCYPNTTNSYSKNIRVSKAHQLALTVIFYSPLQSMLWYGKPNEYTDEHDIEFFRYVPTVWNQSLYLAGDIAKGVSVARRNGSTWFLGNAAGLEDWKADVRLDFLIPGKAYTATLFEDDGNGGIRKVSRAVKKGDKLSIDLKAKTGQAIMIELAEGH